MEYCAVVVCGPRADKMKIQVRALNTKQLKRNSKDTPKVTVFSDTIIVT